MRITVRRVLEILATYQDRAELFQEEDLRQSLNYAATAMDDGILDLNLVA